MANLATIMSLAGGAGVKSVQAFTTVQSADSVTATLATSVDTANSIIFWSVSFDAVDPEMYVRVDLQNSTTVRSRRYTSSSATATVKGFVVEFQPGAIKSLQRGDVVIAGGNTTGTATISAVDTSKTILNYLGSSNDTAGSGAVAHHNYVASLVLTNSTTITATKGSNFSNVTSSFEAIEFN